MSRTRVFCGDRPVAALDPYDRGLAYGDGLFETMRIAEGQVPWWPRHRARLVASAGLLAIPLPSADVLDREVAALAADCGEGVLKLILTRGSGPRGYPIGPDIAPGWLLAGHPVPPPTPSQGLRLRWCDLRLSRQPRLAGLKHLNRLEVVLARREWSDPDIDDGLLCDEDGRLVGATSANVFAYIDGRWWTPSVERCGVAGLCRGWLLEQGLAAVADLDRADLERGDAVFLCNAVRGILPVAQVDSRHWAASPATADLVTRLLRAMPAFAPPVGT